MYVYIVYSNIYTQRNNYAESNRSQMVLLIHPIFHHVGVLTRLDYY
jgi:hypothetical protein